MAADFETEMHDHMRLNRAALYDFRQVNRTLVVSVNENVEISREVLHEVRAMRQDIREMSGMLKVLTEAVLLVLDELRGNDGPSAATT